jgi:LytS/YehU family sensor histidine kinase
VFPFPRLSLFWRFQLTGWTLFALFTIPFKLYAYPSIAAVLILTAVREPIGLALSSLLRLLFRRYFSHDNRSLRLGFFVVSASLLFGAIDALFGRALMLALGYHEEPQVTFGIFCFRASLYAGWSILYLGLRVEMAARARALSLARAETAAREVELQLLRTQVDPHFLFNALNTILATLGPDQIVPKRIVDGLSAYLRYSLQHRHDAFVPLHAEFDATLAYLAVEQERFRGELLAECRLEDAAREFPVPGVLLQPLVENAVKYARQTSEPPYHVRLQVTASLPGDRPGQTPAGQQAGTVSPGFVLIEVANSGEWVEPSPTPGPHGTGLANLRQRLALLYPGRHELTTAHADGWVHVKLRLSTIENRPT